MKTMTPAKRHNTILKCVCVHATKRLNKLPGVWLFLLLDIKDEQHNISNARPP